MKIEFGAEARPLYAVRLEINQKYSKQAKVLIRMKKMYILHFSRSLSSP
jgi:hypothetical protein